MPASKTYLASLLALALISAAIEPDPAFEKALHEVPDACALPSSSSRSSSRWRVSSPARARSCWAAASTSAPRKRWR